MATLTDTGASFIISKKGRGSDKASEKKVGTKTFIAIPKNQNFQIKGSDSSNWNNSTFPKLRCN
jgi:hypothetical protein